MHLCPDELNALCAGLPFVDHLVCHARHAWQWLASRARRRQPPISRDAKTRSEAVTIMGLCETEQLVLHPNQLYRFMVMPDCARCAELADVETSTDSSSERRRG